MANDETTATAKRPWGDIETDLLESVFYAHDPKVVLATDDLAKKGMLDSLSIVAILEILAEGSGNDEALNDAQAADFRNLALIRTLYERL